MVYTFIIPHSRPRKQHFPKQKSTENHVYISVPSLLFRFRFRFDCRHHGSIDCLLLLLVIFTDDLSDQLVPHIPNDLGRILLHILLGIVAVAFSLRLILHQL